MVEIIVGDDVTVQSKSIHAHKALLTAKSSWFKCALKLRFKEGIQKKVYLKNHHPDTFQIFIQWLYSGDFAMSPGSSKHSSPFHGYILGDFLQATDFTGYCMDRLFTTFALGSKACPIDLSTIDFVYKSTTNGSVLRKFVALTVATHLRTQRSAALYGKKLGWGVELETAPEFLVDLVLAFKLSLIPASRQYMDWGDLRKLKETTENDVPETGDDTVEFEG